MLDNEHYVVVNIWTSAKNKALEGANVGHVSLETSSHYISLWPGKRPRREQKSSLFSALDKFFQERPSNYKQGYQDDCVLEAMSEGHYRAIEDIDEIEQNEVAFLFDTETHQYKKIDKQPAYTKESERLLALELVPANVRLVLYGLNEEKVTEEFARLKNSVTGWTLAGSNVFTRNFTSKTSENCASLAYRCLSAGGMYTQLKSKITSQTSSAVSPDDLVRHIVAAKEKELKKYPKTATWQVKDIEESNVAEIKKAYEAIGQNANAEDDFIPESKPSNTTCVIC